MSLDTWLILVLALAAVCFVCWQLYKKNNELKELQKKYEGIIDIDREIEERRSAIDEEVLKKQAIAKESEEKNAELVVLYGKRRRKYQELLEEIQLLQEDMEFIDLGIYNPHFEFDTSEEYKQRILDVRAKQKAMVKAKNAAVCHIEWTVSGSKVEGRKMTNQQIRLMLRAFNGECDAAISRVNWNNVFKMKERIKKSWAAINKSGESSKIGITSGYRDLKIRELTLSYEHKQKKHEEKEEQQEIRRQMREEERVNREIEKAKKEAEDEEKRYKKALEKARAELGAASDEKVTELDQKISDLQKQLEQAREKKERALSMAQLTKSGHVYVISNIGSFGEKVFKIGMTRRLEPLDRVRELGDASVPFAFDVHAMIYSENAPELEKQLHYEFNSRRVNLVNRRKEFFRVALNEIETVVHKNHAEIEFTRLAEAREWRETSALIEKRKSEAKIHQAVEERFPAEI